MPALRCMMLVGLGVAMALAGCTDKGLVQIRNTGDGPDEFMVMPVEPLEPPPDFDVLPAPTPGGTNRVDTNPKAEAVTALGGRASALSATEIPASDGALVNYSARYGVPSNIRQSLAETDAEFRRRQTRGTRLKLFPVDRYEQAYRRQRTDPFQETWRFRRIGAETPTSPPEDE